MIFMVNYRRIRKNLKKITFYDIIRHNNEKKEKTMKFFHHFLLLMIILVFISCDNETSDNTPSWVFNRSYDLGGSGDGQFNLMTGIAIDLYHNIYISDINNNRIQKLSEMGVYITKWGTGGTGNGAFNWPRGMVVDSEGNVYVADQINYRVQKFGGGGAYMDQVGSQGSNPAQFEYIYYLAIDTHDNVFVVDNENNRIQKFNSSLTYMNLWTYTYTTYVSGIATDSNDNVYIVLIDPDNSTHAMVVKYDNSGNLLTSWSFQITTEGVLNANGIAIDSDNRVHTVMSDNTFYVFDTEGELLLSWDDDDYTEGDFESIGDIAFDDEDNLYCTDIRGNEDCVLHIFTKQ
jgi:tripartite motif-containing protein 71